MAYKHISGAVLVFPALSSPVNNTLNLRVKKNSHTVDESVLTAVPMAPAIAQLHHKKVRALTWHSTVEM